MLVDLGRNDLGRVCVPGTVRVDDYSHIERYSHVMHLVSTVTGLLADGRPRWTRVTACFPAGTLSGAPKVRAMELIEEVEKTRRGLYGGVVGYLDFAGNADFAIAIRTALMRDGTAYVQAGGGVVADSNGPYEYTEAANKAKAVLNAIAAAETLDRPVIRVAQLLLVLAAGGAVGGVEAGVGGGAVVRRARPAQDDDVVRRRRGPRRWCRSRCCCWRRRSRRWRCAAGRCVCSRCWWRWSARAWVPGDQLVDDPRRRRARRVTSRASRWPTGRRPSGTTVARASRLVAAVSTLRGGGAADAVGGQGAAAGASTGTQRRADGTAAMNRRRRCRNG